MSTLRLALATFGRLLVTDLEQTQEGGERCTETWQVYAYPAAGNGHASAQPALRGRISGRADSRSFVRAAYRSILGRSADPDGLLHYMDALNAGSMSRQRVLEVLIDSDEARASGQKFLLSRVDRDAADKRPELT
jgi:hypothetical protein